MDDLNFGQALEALEAGKRVARASWTGETISFLYLVRGSSFTVTRPPLLRDYAGHDVAYAPHIDAFWASPTYSKGKGKLFATTWSPTMEDLLAKDWSIREL